MSESRLDPTFKVQKLAPTERYGPFHARMRRELADSPWIGSVVVEKFATDGMDTLGTVPLGDGPRVAHVIVMEDGLGGSGAPVFIPDIFVIPEERTNDPWK